MKKIVLFGASGTIGQKIQECFKGENFEVVCVGRKEGDYLADFKDPKSLQTLFQKTGKVDAVICAAGEAAFAPLENLDSSHWQKSVESKMMGQIQLALQSIPNLNDNGSITLISGVLSEYPVKGGVTASTVNRAVEGFVMAAACEMPRGIRINVVSPNMLVESEAKYKTAFPGVKAVPGADVALAFKRSVMGIQTGQIMRVF